MKHSAFIVSTLIVLMARVIHVSAQAQLDPNTTIWTQVGQRINGPTFNANMSLSGDGTVIAFGGTNWTGDPGRVRVYRIDSGNWTQVGEDIIGEGDADRSGNSISLSYDGSVVAIGAPHNDGNGVNSGHVRVYHNNSGAWIQVGEDIDGEAANDEFGKSISLSSDGSVVAVAAPLNDGSGEDSGHVRIYRNDSGTWAQVGGDIDGGFGGDLSASSIP